MTQVLVQQRNILSESENLVLYLIKCCTKTYGCLSRSIEWIAKKVRISYRHAKRVIKKLFEEGLIEKLECPGRQNHYRATDLRPQKKAKNFRSYKQNSVQNCHLSQSYEQKNVPGMSPYFLRENTPPIQYNLPSEDIDKSVNGTSPDNISKEKTEKETWRDSVGFQILSRVAGSVANLIDNPALQRLYTLCEADAHDIARQFVYVKKKLGGFVTNPSRLITKLVAGFLSKKRANGQETPKSSQNASKLEMQLIQNLERLGEYELLAEPFDDGYYLIPNSCWRYHVIGKVMVFRNLETDKVVEFSAITRDFISSVNEFWAKITQQK